jgi:hypothetical protein
MEKSELFAYVSRRPFRVTDIDGCNHLWSRDHGTFCTFNTIAYQEGMKGVKIWLPAVAASLGVVLADSSNFTSCVDSLGDGDLTVVTAASPDYSNASQPFNLRIQNNPQAILYPWAS